MAPRMPPRRRWHPGTGTAVACAALSGCYFGFYDTLKPLLLGDRNVFLANFLLGWGVTISAGYASYPLDTVRRYGLCTRGTRGLGDSGGGGVERALGGVWVGKGIERSIN